jgi:hypothetical protein
MNLERYFSINLDFSINLGHARSGRVLMSVRNRTLTRPLRAPSSTGWFTAIVFRRYLDRAARSLFFELRTEESTPSAGTNRTDLA